MSERRLFTSESVTEGHPDKIADQISDAVLDVVLGEDPAGRVACETFVTTGVCIVGGEITTSCWVDVPQLVREVVREIGYTDARFGFDYETVGVISCIDKQSADIAMGVDAGGAGDQGMMFGYACDETKELMPLPIMLAHGLVRQLTAVRKEGVAPLFRPDGKSQVTVEYDGDRPLRVHTVVVSAQHSPDYDIEQVRDAVRGHVIEKVIPEELRDDKMIVHVNPTGRFVTGGPQGDAGLTGRKVIVDTYGGKGAHGGGCFSGKDPTKVDRSGAYAARHVAKNVVAAGLARRCTVQVAYAIGVAEPVSIMVDAHGTGEVPDARIVELVRKNVDLRPREIIKRLDLLKPVYRRTAAYGHFGREEDGFTWEKRDLVGVFAKG